MSDSDNGDWGKSSSEGEPEYDQNVEIDNAKIEGDSLLEDKQFDKALEKFKEIINVLANYEMQTDQRGYDAQVMLIICALGQSDKDLLETTFPKVAKWAKKKSVLADDNKAYFEKIQDFIERIVKQKGAHKEAISADLRTNPTQQKNLQKARAVNDLKEATEMQECLYKLILDFIHTYSSEDTPKWVLERHIQIPQGLQEYVDQTLQGVATWNDPKLKAATEMWLSEIQQFATVPGFITYLLQTTNGKLLLLEVRKRELTNEKIVDQEHSELRTVIENLSDRIQLAEKTAIEKINDAIISNYRHVGQILMESSGFSVVNQVCELGYLSKILHLLQGVSGVEPREYKATVEQEEQSKMIVTTAVKPSVGGKKKGTGYQPMGNLASEKQLDLKNNDTKDLYESEDLRKFISIINRFLQKKDWVAPPSVLEEILESCLLPLLERNFRQNWEIMVKNHMVYKAYFELCQNLCKHASLAKVFLPIDPHYQPEQNTPIHKQLTELSQTAIQTQKLLKQIGVSEDEKTTLDQKSTLIQLAIDTSTLVQEAIEDLIDDDEQMNDILSMPVGKMYKELLSGLRFDQMDVPSYHYNQLAQQNQNPPEKKKLRLIQEISMLANNLPDEHTNSIFVRTDRQRIDKMKAMISGSIETPYAHGLYEFDLFFENAYPEVSPKMNLTTTGGGKIRFNPNLYACGKVCLSLLGTWRGTVNENWNPKISNIYQLLLSVQAIIMSNEVYFNEPGYESKQGTKEGEACNEGYFNIIRYGNIKWAMLEMMNKPPPGFESVIMRHFYCKREAILVEVNNWVKIADTNEAKYDGLVSSHNGEISRMFTKPGDYKRLLIEQVDLLTTKLNSLEKPNNLQIKQVQQKKLKVKKLKQKVQTITEGKFDLEKVDVNDDGEVQHVESNPDDEKRRNLESRQRAVYGADATAKMAKAHVFLSGAGALGIEIAKNIVLAGCKSFTLHDTKTVSTMDLSGQFFLSAKDQKEGKHRGEACFKQIQHLNNLVKCHLAPAIKLPKDTEALMKEPWCLHLMSVVVLSEADYSTNQFVNEFCRTRNIKFISTDVHGVFGRVFNDFGTEFEVLDKNGEELQEVNIKSISNEENGIVKVLETVKLNLEDGEQVQFSKVEGMLLPEEQKTQDPSINGTTHTVVKVIDQYSFQIGDTTGYSPYVGNGVAKQLKTVKKITFKSFADVMYCQKPDSKVPVDDNLAYVDFTKLANNDLTHVCFEALDRFKNDNNGQTPRAWDLSDAQEFIELALQITQDYAFDKTEDLKRETNFFYSFAFQCAGVFNPLCAFFGGFVAQEVIKGITGKFTPTNQAFYYDASELLPKFNVDDHLDPNGDTDFFDKKYMKAVKAKPVGHRSDGLRICLGQDTIDKLAHCRLFMVGAGAIGCELLKNYAMCGVGTAPKTAKQKGGEIVVTDPDVIELSNLNRQFLFRMKHIQKPKSQVAAAAAVHMNPEIGSNIVARQDKVHEGTANIFTDNFFEQMNVVTNALDNVKARIYIDQRCVSAYTPLLESGTLGPKGHIQVILPGKTETYGQMTDPEDNADIPVCTLKMFPEETIHCIEWAKDFFGQLFTQMPKSALTIMEENYDINPVTPDEVASLKAGLKLLRKRPRNFNDCIEFARKKFDKFFNHAIRQLLHVYPLDAKTKEGTPFWNNPKRPPSPVDFNKDDELHCTFITSLACLLAQIFFLPLPHEKPRSVEFKKACGEKADAVQVPEFKLNEEKAKAIQAEIAKADKSKEEEQEEEKEEHVDDLDKMKTEFLAIFATLPINDKNPRPYDEYLVHSEEFEKDVDENFHIDFMYSMGNCRALNYKLEVMDWDTVKIKAGKIVPAIATTTACIAGLQTLELIKVLMKAEQGDHKNIFLNLAVPIMSAPEPADEIKTKLTKDLSVSIWDRWNMDGSDKTTLKDVISHIETTYAGLEVQNILHGQTPLLIMELDTIPGMEKKHAKKMNTPVFELTECEQEDDYVDLSISVIAATAEATDKKELMSTPIVRVFFQNYKE